MIRTSFVLPLVGAMFVAGTAWAGGLQPLPTAPSNPPQLIRVSSDHGGIEGCRYQSEVVGQLIAQHPNSAKLAQARTLRQEAMNKCRGGAKLAAMQLLNRAENDLEG